MKFYLFLIGVFSALLFSACNKSEIKEEKLIPKKNIENNNIKTKNKKIKLNNEEIKSFEISVGLLRVSWDEFKVSKEVYSYIFTKYPKKINFQKNINKNLKKEKKIIKDMYLYLSRYDINKYLFEPLNDINNKEKKLRKEDENLIKSLKMDSDIGYLNALFSSCTLSNINLDIYQDSVNFAESNKLNDKFLSQLKKLRSIEYKNFWIIDRELKKLGIKEGCVTSPKKKKKTIPKD